jgi:hypothetical protein
MTVIDKILSEWSYRCSDGIVDMNNPTKRAILNAILEENGLDETELDEINIVTYDDIIKDALKKANKLTPNGDIPQVKKNNPSYILGANENVNGDDAEIFKILYPIAPRKKNQDIESAGSKGSGHGEIALYWLFAYQNPPQPVSGNPGLGKADLIIDGKGVEVKAYNSKSMTFGRIGSDYENLELLNTLFGLQALLSSIDLTIDNNKQANSLRFSKKDIVQSFETLQKFNENDKLKNLSEEYPLIKLVYSKIEKITDVLTKDPNIKFQADYTAEKAAASLMKNILRKKIIEKMGEKGGFIVNVDSDGKLIYYKIDPSLIAKIPDEKILKMSINQGALNFNPEDLFPSK